jgi:uncharacterized membrane protein
MWREELVHPLFVHFPIALLVIGSFLLLFARTNLLTKAKYNLLFSSRLLIVIGSLFSWITVYTGTLADSVVGREVCDPTVLEDHERYGYYVAILFSTVSLLEIGFNFIKSKLKANLFRFLKTLSLLLAIGGTVFLGYEAHLGGKLVYQQAAGVHQPSADCKEFE